MATTARAKKKPAAKKPAATKKPTKATPTPKVLTGPDGATPRYLAFLAREKDEHQGRSVWGLPGETADTRLKVQFEKPGEWRTFTAAGLDPSAPAHAGSVPLAKLGGTGKFLTVKITDPHCPVAVFDPDDGALHAAFPSLDAFLAVLVDKSTRTPHDRLDAAVEKANTLQEKERWTDALELIEPLLDEIPAHVRLEGDDTLARAFNLRGICLENTGRIDDALAAYEKSLLAGDLRAALNVLDVYEDARPDPAKLVERGEAMKRELFFMDAYGATWLRRYLARAYFELGKPREAEVQLRELLERFEVKEPERIDEARAGLEAYVKERSGTPGAALAAAALQWFKKKSYDVSPEEAKRNREWWNAQTPELRAALVKGTGLDGDAEPTDAQLARCFDVESISLRIEGSDLSSFTRFPRLKRVILEGDPDTLEPLRALSLQRITINNVLYKSVDEWPSRAERDLLNAARKADREGLERALAAGADVNARDRWGATPLMLVGRAARHDTKLQLWLIEQGADPWATDCHDSRAWFEETLVPAVEAAAKAAGIVAPETSPWRVLEAKREHRGASFDSVRNVEYLDLGKGKRFLTPRNAWPKNARYDFAGNKADDKLFDGHQTHDGFIVSERVRTWLDAQQVPGLELLPVALRDRNNKARGTYWALNPLPQDCLDARRAHAHWNHIAPESISDYSVLAIDETKLDPQLPLFRVARLNSSLIVVRRAFAEALMAQGFTGLACGLPRR